MEEDNPYAEGLSYTEDVPYEAQIDEMPSVDPDPKATENGQSLRKRIGKRIYLVDDMLLKRVSYVVTIVLYYTDHYSRSSDPRMK